MSAPRPRPLRAAAVLVATMGALTVVTAPAARADGLSASAGDRLGDTAVLVAGRPAAVVSSLYLDYSEDGCAAADLGPGAQLTVTFTAPGALRVSSPLTRTITLRASTGRAGDPGVVNATWQVRATRAGMSHGTVAWSGTSRAGRVCSTSQRFAIVAASGPPRLRVAGAYQSDAHALNISLKATLPGVSSAVAHAGFGSPFDGFFAEQHDTSDDAGEGGRDVLDLVTPLLRGARIAAASGFGGDGVSCVDVGVKRVPARLGYRLHFTWNHAIGARTVRRTGHVRVTRRPHTAADRACAAFGEIAYGR